MLCYNEKRQLISARSPPFMPEDPNFFPERGLVVEGWTFSTSRELFEKLPVWVRS